MSKICKSCGKYYDGDFCDKCGYGNKNLKVKAADKYKKRKKPVRFMTEEEKQEYYKQRGIQRPKKSPGQRKKSNKNKNVLIFLILIATAVIVAGLVSSGVISFADKEDVIVDYFDAINEKDFDKYIGCLPAEAKKAHKQDREDMNWTKKQYMEKIAERFEENVGKDLNVTVKLGRSKKIENYNTDNYKALYGSAPSVSEVYKISATLTIKGSDGKMEVHSDIYMGKISGRWKVLEFQQIPGTIPAES